MRPTGPVEARHDRPRGPLERKFGGADRRASSNTDALKRATRDLNGRATVRLRARRRKSGPRFDTTAALFGFVEVRPSGPGVALAAPTQPRSMASTAQPWWSGWWWP